MSIIPYQCVYCWRYYNGLHDCPAKSTVIKTKEGLMMSTQMETEKELENSENAFIIKCLLLVLDLPATQKDKIVSVVVASLVKSGRDFIK